MSSARRTVVLRAAGIWAACFAVAVHASPAAACPAGTLGGMLVVASAEGAGAAEAEAGHGDAAGINPLSFEKIKADLAIWTAVVFLVLLALLWKYAWGPIADGLDKRERRIAAEIEAAQKANREAKAQLAEYQQKLASAGQEVQRMLEEARREAEKVGEQIVAKAREDAQAEHQRALAEIESATAAALQELAQRSADLAIELAGRIVQDRLDRTQHARLIEEAVARFARPKSNGN